MELMCEACGYAETLHKPEGHAFVRPKLITSTLTYSPVPSEQEKEASNILTLEREIASVLNRHSAENGSNTPDFILAEYLLDCLEAYNKATKKTRDWQGVGYLNVGTEDS